MPANATTTTTTPAVETPERRCQCCGEIAETVFCDDCTDGHEG